MSRLVQITLGIVCRITGGDTRCERRRLTTMAPRVKLTNAEKVLYPATGTTKADVFDYYVRVSEFMLPHIAGRPTTRKRWPNGVDESSFFEKQLATSAPEWLPRGEIAHKSGTTTYPIIDSTDALAWI